MRRQFLIGIALILTFSVSVLGGIDARLAEAAKARDKATLLSLLQKRVDVNASETDGTTALHWVVRQNDLELANLLLRAGANVKVKNRYGVTPLSLAALNGSAPM